MVHKSGRLGVRRLSVGRGAGAESAARRRHAGRGGEPLAGVAEATAGCAAGGRTAIATRGGR